MGVKVGSWDFDLSEWEEGVAIYKGGQKWVRHIWGEYRKFCFEIEAEFRVEMLNRQLDIWVWSKVKRFGVRVNIRESLVYNIDNSI